MAEETIAPETIEAAPEAASEAQPKPNPIASYFQKKYYPNKSVKEVQEFIYSNKDNYDKAVNRMYDDTYAGKIDKSAFDAKLVQEYGDPFPAKKKVSTPDLPSISKASGTPSVTSPKPTSTKPVDTFTAQPDLNTIVSQGQADNYAPVTNPQVKQQLVAQDDAIRQKRKAEQDRLTQQLSKVVKEVPGMDKVLEYNANRTPDVLREPDAQERAHQDFMNTNLGKTLGAVAYMGRGAAKGTLQIAKGAATLANDAFNTGNLNTITKVAGDYVMDKADDNTNMGLSKSDVNDYDTKKGFGYGLTRGAAQLAEIAPTIAGGEALNAPKAMFFLQGTGQGKETMDAVKKSGAKVNPIIEKVFPYATGAINGLLMGDLGETLFGKIPSGARSAVVNSIAAEALEKSAGKELTGEALQTLLRDGAKTFADKFEQTGIKALSHYNTTVKDLAKLQTANYLLKKGVDEVNDTPVFQENLGNLAEGLSRMATTEAPLFAATGVAKDAVHMLMPNSSFKNEIVNSLVENPTAENVDHIKKQLYDYGFDQDKTDKWSPEQMQATYEQVDKIAKVAQSLPKGLNAEKGAKAVDLINGRNDLKEQLAKLQEQKATLDPSLHNLVNPYEQNLLDKIDQADDKLRTLATGKQATYRAGTGDEEGKYFKKVDGKDEEISKSRYELEHFERNARSEADIEPVSEEQPKDEQTPITQENVARNEGNEPIQTTFTNADIENADPNEPQNAKIKAVQDNFADGDKVEFKVDGKVLNGEVKNGRIQDEEGNHWGWLGILTGKDNYIKKLDSEQGIENNPVEGGVPENEAPAGNTTQEATSSPIGEVGGQEGKQSPEVQVPVPDGEEAQKNRTKWVDPANKANVEELAENHGIELEDTVGETRTKKVVNKEARQAIKDGLDPRDLVQEILETDRKSDTDVAILSKHLEATERRVKDIKSRLEKDGATMSKADFDDLMNERERAFKELSDAAQASRKLQTISGRQLNAFKQMVTRDYSLGDLLSRKREANGNNELTKEQVQEVNDRFDELEKTRTALEKRIAKLEEDNAKLKAENKVKNSAAERLRRKSVSKEKLAEERKQIADDFSKKLKEMRSKGALNSVGKATAEFLAAAAPYVAKMVRNLAEEGITELKDVIGRVKEELDLKDLSDREVTDLIGGVYDEKKPTKSELSERVSSLKQQAKLAAQIEDLENGIKRVKPESSAAAKKNEQVEALRKRLAELNSGEEVPKEVKDLNRYKKSKQDQIDELNKKIAAGDYSKPEPAKPVTLDPEALTLRRKYDRLKHEFDVGVERDKLDKRTRPERIKDIAVDISSLPRALKATLDFSAVLRQGLIHTVRHPIIASKAFSTMWGHTWSEEKYQDWFSDLKHTPEYELIKNSKLYISEKSSPELLAREEDFTSNLAEKIPFINKSIELSIKGKTVKIPGLQLISGSERAYSSYLNALRVGVFLDESAKLQEAGYTFEENPEQYKALAKVINVFSGRGDIPELLGGDQPKLLSFAFFSPRFWASRIQTLYMPLDFRLPARARVLAAKDLAASVGTISAILTMAHFAGYNVNLDWRSPNFMKLTDGNTHYDFLAGLSQQLVIVGQNVMGEKKPVGGKGGIQHFNLKDRFGRPKHGAPTYLSNALNTFRGKLAPLPGMVVNLAQGQDYVGTPYDYTNIPGEFVPLPYGDIKSAYQQGGLLNAIKVAPAALFGIGVSSYDVNKKK